MGKVSRRVQKVYTIYALIDPRVSSTPDSSSVRYIGITYDIYQRMRQHSRCEGDNELKNAWVRELQKEHLVFIMHSIEKVKTFETALAREAYWIEYYLKQGAQLTNLAGTSEKKPKPTGPKWILSPQEASLLFFKDSTGHLVNVPFAPHEEFDAFVRRYVRVTEGPRDNYWDKSNRRNVLSYMVKNGIQPPLYDEHGNPVQIDWPKPVAETEEKFEAYITPLSDPRTDKTTAKVYRAFLISHNSHDIDTVLDFSEKLIGYTFEHQSQRYIVQNAMLADADSSHPDLRIVCFTSLLAGGNQ